jgi:hypothetical protein
LVENNHLFQEADPPEEWANDTASEGFITTSPLVRLADQDRVGHSKSGG